MLVSKKEITIAEAKRLLEGEEELDPLQRRVMDYASKFSKLPAERAAELVETLMREAQLERAVAVQIANCLPASVEEVRTLLGRQRIISEEALNRILEMVERYTAG
jgi:DNA-directed RNA polymerase subunit F